MAFAQSGIQDLFSGVLDVKRRLLVGIPTRMSYGYL